MTFEQLQKLVMLREATARLNQETRDATDGWLWMAVRNLDFEIDQQLIEFEESLTTKAPAEAEALV